ncbi:MAG: hypothetical protein H6739_38660 [Alphaproteobacteria bacterium]|nr:hypothetical protein [Alphaproteobacteria bacterium]
MPKPKWEKLKKTFRSDTDNTKRYRELRPIVQGAIQDVLAILADLQPTVPFGGTLTNLQANIQALSLALTAADQDLGNNQVNRAITSMINMATRAQALSAEAFTERNAHFMTALNRAKAHIRAMEQNGVDDADAMLNVLDMLAFDLIAKGKRPRVFRIKTTLEGFITDLPALEGVTRQVADAVHQLPDNLTQNDLNRHDLARTTVFGHVSGFDLANARNALVLYTNLVAELINIGRQQQLQGTLQGPDPTERYKRYVVRIDDVLDFPDNQCSAAILQHKNLVAAARQTYLQRALTLQQTRDNAENNQNEDLQQNLDNLAETARTNANDQLDVLIQRLTQASKPLTKHRNAMVRYYAALKKLRPDITLADALPATDTQGDTRWKVQRLEYDKVRRLVKEAVDPPTRDYARGLLLLPELQNAIQELKAWRLKALQKDLKRVTDPETGFGRASAQLVVELSRTPGLIRALEPEQQLALLQSMRTQLIQCRDCGKSFDDKAYKIGKQSCPFCQSVNLDAPAYCANKKCQHPGLYSQSNRCPKCKGASSLIDDCRYNQLDPSEKEAPGARLVEARALILSEMDMTPEFKERDQQQRSQLLNILGNDPTFLEAQQSWETWCRKGKAKEIEAFFNHVIKLQCGVMGHNQTGLRRKMDGLGVVKFDDAPVKVNLIKDKENPGESGLCQDGFPTVIDINLFSNSFGSFMDQVDTVLHENTHAWQQMITKMLRMEKPYTQKDRERVLNDPALKVQAQLFLENEESYFNHSKLKGEHHRVLRNKAYRHQPVEEHAWTLGGKLSRSLAAPPDVQSLASKQKQRQVFFVESVERDEFAQVILRDKHGLREQEVDQERLSDLRVTLSGVLQGGLPRTIQVTLSEVKSEWTVDLDDNLSNYDEDDEDEDYVKLQGARLTIDRTPRDL